LRPMTMRALPKGWIIVIMMLLRVWMQARKLISTRDLI
jgi:hypothetical protein